MEKKPIKFTEEEVTQINNLRIEASGIFTQLGQISLERKRRKEQTRAREKKEAALELKQMLILKENNIFEKCILNSKNDLVKSKNINIEKEYQEPEPPEPLEQKQEVEQEEPVEPEPEPEAKELVEPESNDLVNEVTETDENAESNVSNNEIVEERDELNEVEELIENKEPIEFEIDLENLGGDVLNLKKKNDIYYEMYREALKRAKSSKDLALTQFLEAKRIKNTYMLEDLDDSDLEEDSINSDE